jgi:hypothetical protein
VPDPTLVTWKLLKVALTRLEPVRPTPPADCSPAVESVKLSDQVVGSVLPSFQARAWNWVGLAPVTRTRSQIVFAAPTVGENPASVLLRLVVVPATTEEDRHCQPAGWLLLELSLTR